MDSFEQRLDSLRLEAQEKGSVAAPGVHAAGGPIPKAPLGTSAAQGTGYYGLPIVKPPVWEWMIAIYFFVGGLAGMSGLIALAALTRKQFELTRVALWPAAVGALLSTILLVWDLGRPKRFIYMLRVFKYQSPMSLGSWILSLFGGFATFALVLVEWQWRTNAGAVDSPTLQILTTVLVTGAGLTGIFLATYTGALVAVTAVPAWNVHRVLLPIHFGTAGLGSAAGLMELAGFRLPALHAIGFLAAGVETLVLLWMELRRHGAVDKALHEGKSGWTLRLGELLEGPAPLVLRALGFVPWAAGAFLLGAFVTRFGWLWAGRASANDPKAVFESQQGPGRTAETAVPYSLHPTIASIPRREGAQL